MGNIDENVLDEAKAKLKQSLNIVKATPHRFAPSGSLKTIQAALEISPRQLPLTGFNEFVNKAFGWIPLNPSNEERVRALVSSYYIPGYENFNPEESSLECPHPISKEYGDHIESQEYSNKLPIRQGMLTLFECITKSRSHLITISGRRGTGKTMVINFFLTTAHKKLSENGFLWFRTDIAKLWAMENDSLTVTQYTIIHSLYIALKYSKFDLNLNIMQPISDESELDKVIPGKLFRNYLNEVSANQAIIDLWDDVVKNFKWVERVYKDKKPVSSFINKGKELIHKHSYQILKELFAEMIAFLKLKTLEAGRTLEILIILDGVDNIRAGAHQDRYFSLLKEINLMLLDDPIIVGDRYMLVARPETFHDFDYIRTAMTVGRRDTSEFEIDSDFIADLVKKKRAAIENPTEYFMTTAQKIIGPEGIGAKEIECLAESINYLLEHLERAGAHLQSLKGLPRKCSPVDLVFDGNIRSMLRNCIRAHSHKKRLKKVTHKRTLLEGSVLAGCNSMTINLNDNVRGRWCPNLFENAEIHSGQWTGLTLVRLIQLLNAISEGLTYDEIVDFLHANFKYPIGLINIAFQTALEYALIRAINFRVNDVDREFARPKKHLLFATTPKGKYILKLAFEDYAVFYFMSVATPLDLDRVESRRIDLKLLTHSESDDHRHFFRAAILSGTILWTHVYTADCQERAKLDQNLTSKNVRLVQAFQIEGIDAWPLLAESRLKGIKRYELRAVAETLVKYTANYEGGNA